MSDLAKRVEQLESELTKLRGEREARHDQLTERGGGGRMSRRKLLIGGAAAGAGVAGAMLAATPVGAATNDPVLVDNAHTGTGTTSLTSDFATAPALVISNTGAGGAANAIQASANVGTGVVASGSSAGVSGSTTSGSGVTGFSATGDGVRATSTSGIGLLVNAPTEAGAHMKLNPASSAGAPSTSPHTTGQFWVDQNGALFQCIQAGAPGTWVRHAPFVP